MEFKVLGPLEVRDGNADVALTSPKQRRLLAALVIQANEVVSTDRLVELVWREDERPEREAPAVQTYVSRLRAALGAGDVLTRSEAGYLLRVAPGQLDVARFEALVAEAREAAAEDHRQALACLDEALALWRGPAYGELAHEDFVQPEAVRLEELRLAALEDRAEVMLALGEHERLVGELEALVSEQPLRERARAQLMVALYRSGRHPDALRAYQEHRRVLGEELGLEPGPPLRDLEERILRHDPTLAPPPPPARSLPRPAVIPPATVTTPGNSFMGRQGVVTALSDELGRSRLVTLTGPGGVGKTRLATEVAVEAGPRFAEGAVVCSLAPLADADAVASVLSTTLGLQQRRDRTVEESLIDFLRHRHLLLVVDNCEHLLEGVVPLVERLLLGSERLVVLATSRERLAVAGERVWSVPPLPTVASAGSPDSPPASVELFCDRAQAVRPGVTLGGENLAHVAEICRHLDGMPLAIELAAARVRAMNVADLAQRLEARFRLLDGGSRTADRRHRSLRAVVDWSYELLDESERRVFDRLSVFAGGFTLDSVEDVCAGAGVEQASVVELLGGLVDKSMVTIGTGEDVARYGLLETLRHYGREQLEATGAQQGWHERHASHYLAFAEEAAIGIQGPDEARWMHRLGQDLDNLREAQRWTWESSDVDRALRLAVALHHFVWNLCSPEVFEWAQRAARLAAGSGHPLLPLALGSAALGAWRRDFGEVAELVREAVDAAGGDDDPSARIALHSLGAAALSEGRLQDALGHLGRSAALARAAGDRAQLALSLAVRSLALTYLGEVSAGIEGAEEALVVARDLGAPSLIAWGLYAKGEALMDDQPEQALPLFDESRKLGAGLSSVVAGVAGVSATTLRARHGDPFESLGEFADLLEHWHRSGVWTTLWTTLRNLIQVLVRVGVDEAAVVLHAALLASSTAAPVFGADAERTAVALGDLERRVGPGRLAAWTAQGARLSDDEAVAYARSAIERALTQRSKTGELSS